MNIFLDSFNGHGSQYHNMSKRIEGETIRNQRKDLTITKEEEREYNRTKRKAIANKRKVIVKPLYIP